MDDDMKLKLGVIGLFILIALALSGCSLSERRFTVMFYGDQQKSEAFAKNFIEHYECPDGYAVTFRGDYSVHCRRVR